MGTESFTTALRAELDAVVSRYEAMVRAHQETLEAISEGQVRTLQAKLETMEKERAELSSTIQQRNGDVTRLETRATELERSLAQARDASEMERTSAREATSRAAAAVHDADRRIRELEARLAEIAGLAKMLDEVFAGERRFAESCERAKGTLLHDAVETALGMPVAVLPEVMGRIKAKRADVILTHSIQDRGAKVVQSPLEDRERAALQGMAEASGCELIVPDIGTRHSPSSMDKIATGRDPAEEGNVIECMMPGLRLAGSSGALVFPKVKVGIG